MQLALASKRRAITAECIMQVALQQGETVVLFSVELLALFAFSFLF